MEGQSDFKMNNLAGELDEDIEVIQRRTIAVKADQINEVFMENIG